MCGLLLLLLLLPQVYQDAPVAADDRVRGGPERKGGERWRQTEEELMGLTQCTLCFTLFAALIGGPALMLVALPRDHGYWAGCGFRIPEVGALIIARAEFALQGGGGS